MTPSPAVPSNTTMIVRGLRGRCPRCGQRWPRRHVVSPEPLCATCALPLDAEEGGFTNAMIVNWIVATIIMIGVFVVLMVDLLADGAANPVPYLVGGGLACTLLPTLAYPRTRTLWCAIDLMTSDGDSR